MQKNKSFMKVVLGVLLVSVLSTPVYADTVEYWANSPTLSSYTNTTSYAFTITPFDTTLGTLNSVFLLAEVNIDSSAQIWTYAQDSTLTYSASNTLDAVSEMGWGSTVASVGGSTYVYNDNFGWFDPYWNFGYQLVEDTGNAFLSNTIYSGFGRFAGPVPFDINLNLLGSATSTWKLTPGVDEYGNPTYDDVLFGYTGNARLNYVYDYKPAAVSEPTTMLLLGLGLLGLAGIRRKM